MRPFPCTALLAPSVLFLLGAGSLPVRARALDLRWGLYRAWLDSPGGELGFGLELSKDALGSPVRAFVINGSERIEIPRVRFNEQQLILDISHYDSRIECRSQEDGGGLHGTWKKRLGDEEWCELGFHALAATGADATGLKPPRSIEPLDPRAPGRTVAPRWRVRFESSEDPAVGLFQTDSTGACTGTFLTSTGDYRYLAGSFDGRDLRLSCFDGAHAFLFAASMSEDGELSGDFWSRDRWHERWTARADPDAHLEDPFDQSSWNERVSLESLRFRDLSGVPVSLADERFAGKARILHVFGSWCPNCHDAGEELVRLHRRFKDRGLSIVGLAFEITEDLARNAEMVRRYAARHGVEYPLLIAGPADKEKASLAFPALDRIEAFPTTIFLDEQGKVAAVHTGFSGPATGVFFERQRERFEEIALGLIAAAEERRSRVP